jgi:CPA2 family monovalent cation:H+ antiporter-2
VAAPALLKDLLVILAAALLVAGVLKRAGLPSIAGLLLAGVLVGPGVLGLVSDPHNVEVLSEVGVVLLLFGIGLELSLDRLKRLWRPILLGGGLQVGLTLGAVFGAGLAVGYPPGTAAFLGCIVAVSSTAVVLRGLQARGELDAPHGRLTLGILVFQDLAVVPMMLAIPLLAGQGGSTAAALGAGLRAFAVVAGVLAGARFLVPRLMAFVARTRERDLFVLAILLVCLGTAFLASAAGVSLALGAFLGGLVVAGTGFRHQAAADLIPFREALTGIFFVSVGMALDPGLVLRDWAGVGGPLAAILAGKFLLTFLAAALLRLPLRVAALSAVALCQVGEFSFVLIRAARGTPLLDPLLEGRLTAAVILSMVLTPLALAVAPHVAAGMGRIRPLTRLLGVRGPEESRLPDRMEGHVIVAGYGLAGEELAAALKACGVPHVVADLGVDNVRKARKEGHPALFGDVTSEEVLRHLRVEHAAELVLLLNDPDATARAVRAARAAAPSMPILARTPYVLDVPTLKAAGATEVVAGESEAAAAVAERVLSRRGVCRDAAEVHRARIRGRIGE